MSDWLKFRGGRLPGNWLSEIPAPPPWRSFGAGIPPQPPSDLGSNDFWWRYEQKRGSAFQVLRKEIPRAVNAALYLRRPLLIEGRPGTGKSSLISAVAYELKMGPVLRWPISSRSTLRQGLYEYDALGLLNEQNTPPGERAGGPVVDIGNFVQLGPLGTALHNTSWPRALLIDEIDKSDLDLPNDLLNVFEDGSFPIPELARAQNRAPMVKTSWPCGPDGKPFKVQVNDGVVTSDQFPFVVMTSNGERDFPAPFLRRCIRLRMPDPEKEDLERIVETHLGPSRKAQAAQLIQTFLNNSSNLATDQLLNAVYVTLGGRGDDQRVIGDSEKADIEAMILKELS
ncbi:MAG: MoxR family ATPase [Acidobacteriaceae bacterium]|nr:MoxR family ATPase [Acidobacteriaceae bacterium]